MEEATSLLKRPYMQVLLEDDDDDDVVLSLLMAQTNSDDALAEAICEALLPKERAERCCRGLPRPYGDIWTDMMQVWPGFPGNKENEMYYTHFRMNKEAFYNIFERVRVPLTPERDPRGRKGVEPLAVFAMTLKWLATGIPYTEIAGKFCIAEQTAGKWARIVVDKLFTHVVPDLIRFPRGAELTRVMQDFECLSLLPGIAGAIDGSFIEILKPSVEFADRFWCYKNKIAILLLAVVDAVGRFTFIDAGRPSSLGDVNAFKFSHLPGYIEERIVLGPQHDIPLVVDGEEFLLQPYLIGDEAFTLCKYMMTIYGGVHHPRSKEAVFNAALINARKIVEQAFGRCKQRWRILLTKGTLNDATFMGAVTSVCCALHNFCETEALNKRFEGLPEDWWIAQQDEDDGGEAENNAHGHGGAGQVDGAHVRDVLRDYLAQRLNYSYT